jgi:hypothetical protein
VKRFLLFAGVVGAATYMLAPPHTTPEGTSEEAQVKQHVGGPLQTSWGLTLQILRRKPASYQGVVSLRQNHAYGSRALQEGAYRHVAVGGSGGDPFERATAILAAYSQASESPPTVRSDSLKAELWVIGETNGWVQPEDSYTQEFGWNSCQYIASIDNLGFKARVTATTETPSVKVTSAKTQKPSHATNSHRLAATSKPQEAGPTSKLGVRVSDDVKAAKPHRPRGLFTRGGEKRRGRGLFGFFRGRKAERPAWSTGPTE